MTTLQIGRRLAVVLVVVTVLSSAVVGFTAATTDTTSVTQLDGNESAEAVSTEQPITEVATSVDQPEATSAEVTTDVEVPSTPATTQASPDEAGTEVPTSAESATDSVTEPVTTTAPTTTSVASDPTPQESAVETAKTASNEVAKSTSESTEQPTDEQATSTEATVTETPTETSLEATTEVPSVESSPDASVVTSVETDVESATARTVDESTTGERSVVPTTATTDDAVDGESATTAEPNLADAVATVEEGEETVDSNDSVEAPLTDSMETTRPDVDENQPVTDTTVPAPDDSLESVQAATNTTGTPTSVVNTGESYDDPTGSVTTDQPTETVVGPVDTSGNENISGDGQSNATATIGDSVDTIEDEIESEQVDDASETIEHVDDVATDTTDDADTSTETTENSLNSVNETADGVDEDIEQVVDGVEDDAVASSNETTVGTIESASSTVTENDANTSVEPLFEEPADEMNVSSVVTNGSDQESTSLADVGEFEPIDGVSDESIETNDETVNETVDSTANTVQSIDPTFEEPVGEVGVSSIDESTVKTNDSDEDLTSLDADQIEPIEEGSDELTDIADETVDDTIDTSTNTVSKINTSAMSEPAVEESANETVSTALDDSVAVANGSGDEFVSFDAIDGSEALDNITDESSDSTGMTVDETVNSTTNAVASIDSTLEEPVGENLSSPDDLTVVMNESGDEFVSLDSIDNSEALSGSTNELTNATAETVAETVDSSTNTVPAVEPIFEEPADEVIVSTIDDSLVVTSESDEEPAPLGEIDDFGPLEDVSNESIDVTDETVDGTIDSTANTVESIEPTLDESADEVSLSSLDDSVVVTSNAEELTSLTAVGDSNSVDGVVDGSTDVTDRINDVTYVLENDAVEDVIGTTDETTNVAADSTVNVIESAEPLFEDSDVAIVASPSDLQTVTDGSDGEFTSLDSVTDEPVVIDGQTDELTDVLESDAVEDVAGTTTDATGVDLDGSVDPSLVQLEEVVSDTVDDSAVTTDVESRTTDLVIAGTEAASENLETDDSLVAEADGTIDDVTESTGELVDVRIEPLDETVYATDDLAGTVEDTDRIVSNFDPIDAMVDAERVSAIEAEILIDGTIEGTVGELTVEASERLVNPTGESIDDTLIEAEQTTGKIVGPASTTDAGATTFEVDETASIPSSQDPTLSVDFVQAVDVDGRTPVASSSPESAADAINSEPTVAVPRSDASRTGGTITTEEVVRDGAVEWTHLATTATDEVKGEHRNNGLLGPGRAVGLDDREWVDSPSIHSKLFGDHSVARPTDDGSAAGPVIDSGQPNRPVEGEPSPLDEPESKAVLGLAAIAVGAVTGRFADNASSLQAALSPSMVQLQLRTGVHSIQCWCDRFSFPRIGPIPGYSRYDDSDPLENEIRANVYESIEDSPGVYLTRLSEESSVPRSTLRYHVRILESEGLISAVKVRGRRRFFLADSNEIELATALSDDATAAVLDVVAQLEPASGSRIAKRLDRDPSTASHHLKRLSEAGLVVREREGGAVLNRLSPTARETLTASDRQSAPSEAKV